MPRKQIQPKEADDADRPVRYVETRINEDGEAREVVIYRASGFGGCIRAIVASGLEMAQIPWPSSFLAVLAEGHVAEPHIIAMYERDHDVVVTDQQREVELYLGLIEGRDVFIRGHIDGIDSTGVVVDAKKFRPSTWGTFLRKGIEVHDTYAWQLSAYMLALGADTAALVGGEWEPEVAGDEDGEGRPARLLSIKVVTIDRPVINKLAMIKRARMIEGLINSPIGQSVNMDKAPCPVSWPCHYPYLHGETVDKDVTDISGLPNVDELSDLIIEHRKLTMELAALKPEYDSLEKLRKTISESIRNWITDKGLNEFEKDDKGVEAKSKTFAVDGVQFVWQKAVYQDEKVPRKGYTTNSIVTVRKGGK